MGVVELNISYDIIPLNYYSLEKLGHRPPQSPNPIYCSLEIV